MNKPDSRLLIKATCKQPIQIKIPNVEVINGLIPDEEMEKIHALGDCYVSFSSSEGIGLGAVEAALRNEPVIIRDDFLFKAGMQWGKPDEKQLREFMEDAYTKKLRYMEHPRTHMLTCKENVLQEFVANVIGEENDNTSQNNAGSE